MFSRLLKTVVAAAWVLSATLALALPTPKDIEAAVAAGHYTQAETLLREVLQDKPQSAKAHYELGQVLAHEHRYKDAQMELQKAKEIDPSLKFATSPEKFNNVLAKVNDLAAAPSSSVVMAPSVTPGTQAATKVAPEAAEHSSGSSPLTYVWLVIAALVVLGLWLRRSAASAANQVNAAYAPVATPMGTPPAQRGFGAQYDPRGAAAPGYGYGQPYPAPAPSGSGVAGAVVGGLAGVAAGYALSKALDSHDHLAHTGNMDTPRANDPMADTGLVRMDPGADLGSFDAGAGDDWGGDTGASSDDNW